MLKTRCTNKSLFTGFLSKDAEWEKVGDNISKCKLTVGIPYEDTSSSDGTTHWESHTVEVWRGLADVCKTQKKGSKVLVEGSLRKSTWTGEDNNPKSRSYIVGDRVEFLSAKHTEEPLPSK